MTINNRASTGISGLDKVVDMLRLGDNVVWQVDSIIDYQSIVDPFVRQAKKDGRRLIYLRFGNHRPLLSVSEADRVYTLDASKGFEGFATEVHNLLKDEGLGVFYVFDCLSDLLEYWYSDLSIGNFFLVTCPFLYSLDTIAYFALMRATHTDDTIARIRKTTQLLLDLRFISGKTYIHPLKVAERYSPTMFFPHLIEDDKATSITASSETAMLFADQWQLQQARDFWEITLDRARSALTGNAREKEHTKALLISLIIGKEEAVVQLAERYFTLEDLLYVASREIGTGYIGGKSVGFLLARRIIENDAAPELHSKTEPHDSYYIGSDVFYAYIVENGCWSLRMSQKTPEGYFACANELKEALLNGVFPYAMREQFSRMLEYFGQSPIIVRSSSLQEDSFGNAFAGKYESVFCANQGSPEQRYREFEHAMRRVYASVMSEDALHYRKDRKLTDKDEQMAILVQRVSGDHYDNLFFPHVAGVGTSVNLYLWDQNMDPEAGMIRLVLGLGTRAVDRVANDYARIIALDRPTLNTPMCYGDEARFSQHKADVIHLEKNILDTIPIQQLANIDMRVDKDLFLTPDHELISRMREQGRTLDEKPMISNFSGLLNTSEFISDMQHILQVLEAAYQYPVDIEFAANFNQKREYKINILQCRPLQTRGLKLDHEMPVPSEDQILIKTQGGFMGGSVFTPLDYLVLVDPVSYKALSEEQKYGLAHTIGDLDKALKDYRVFLIGPGRWGSSTPSLGVPVRFTQLSHMTGICELAFEDMTPELSFGSHFFQDLVESNIFYLAVHQNPEKALFLPEKLEALTPVGHIPGIGDFENPVVKVFKTPQLYLHSDIVSQSAFCYFGDEHE